MGKDISGMLQNRRGGSGGDDTYSKTQIDQKDENVLNAALAADHGHENKAILDGISRSDIDRWNAADTVAVTSHLTSGTKIATITVSGAVYDVYAPDSPTAEQIADWNAAAENAHEHGNKDVLDDITAAYTTAEKQKLAGLENYVHPAHTAYKSGMYKIKVDALGHVSAVSAVIKEDITALGIPGKDTVTSIGVEGTGNAITGILYKEEGKYVAQKDRSFTYFFERTLPEHQLETEYHGYAIPICEISETSSHCNELYRDSGIQILDGYSDSVRDVELLIGTESINGRVCVERDGKTYELPLQDTTYSNATTSAAGLLSADDKKKLNSVAPGANKTVIDTVLSSTSTNPVQNKTVATALDKTFQLRGQIGPNTDWNAITEAGCYKVHMAGWGDADTYHSPNSIDPTIYSFGLLFVMVTDVQSEYRISQIYIPHRQSPKILTRMHNSDAGFNTGWQEWSSPACTPLSHTHDYLPLSGNAVSATKLHTPRNINGVAFDGTKDITVNPPDYGWQNLILGATGQVRYRKAGKLVEIDGQYKPANSGGGFTIGTLPEGYRPPGFKAVATLPNPTGSAFFLIQVSTAGALTISGSSASTFTKGTTYDLHLVYFVD